MDMYDSIEDSRVDPLFSEEHVVGLYPATQAEAAARKTMTDLGSGNWQTDD
jgi:hypothetical protein